MQSLVKNYAAPEFWRYYGSLPEGIRKIADKNFKLLRSNPRHPSLHLKKAGIFLSARVGENYRALGKVRAEGVVWVWIGPHDEYDRILGS